MSGLNLPASLPGIVALAFAPALFWFWFFARRDLHPEPATLVLRTFAWGALMLIPASLLETSLGPALGLAGVVLLAAVEELAKYAAASNVARRREFDEPVDGLIYAAAASLGFATLENLLYMLHGGTDLMWMRGPITTLGHVLFSAPWGYAMALKRFRGGRWVLRRGLLLGGLLHSLFNALLLGGDSEGGQWLLIPFVPLLVVMWLLANRYYARVGADCAEKPARAVEVGPVSRRRSGAVAKP